MYAGQVVEYASTRDLFNSPQHPYTRVLMQSVPRLDEHRERLDVIAGLVPDAREFPEGCRFASRCSLAEDHCRSTSVELRALLIQHIGRYLKMKS